MDTKKRLTLLFAMLSLLFTINMVESTYAKYASKTTTSSKMNIARWDIKVNDEAIKDKNILDAEITPNYLDNINVAPGVIAPGSIGYFDITIDPANTDVSFEYEISVTPATDTSVTDLRLLKYQIENKGDMVEVPKGTTTITDEILKTEKDKRKITIYVIWDDSESNDMDNIEDSEVGHNASDASVFGDVKVAMKFKQKIET